MQELLEADFVANVGVSGCSHGRRGSKRQVLLVDRETLELMDLQPGIVRENITTEGLNVNGLARGEQLQIGAVLLEVSAICEPCDQLEKIRPGLREEMRDRRGMLCRVLRGGVIRRGDAIEKIG